MGEVNAGYDTEPWFKGRRVDWFCDQLGNDNEYLDCLESIMNRMTSCLTSAAVHKGSVIEDELPDLPPDVIERLSSRIVSLVKAERLRVEMPDLRSRSRVA